MTTEMTMLLLVTGLTGLLWVPYVVTHILRNGLLMALSYSPDCVPLPAWADRLRAAHRNAIENLVLFAPLVLIAQAMNVHSGTTVLATQVYLAARLCHPPVHALNVPFGRTLAFATGWVCCLILFLEILGKSGA